MSFSSVSFFVFMIAVFLIYWGIPHKFRYILLICANLIFYSSFGVEYLPVILAEVLVAYIAGRLIGRRKSASCFVISIVLIVLPLVVFKYLDFSIYTINKFFSIISVPVNVNTLKLIAPIGISFYTFELISYVADVYNGKAEAENNILRLFVFASFFPNITSGPIERAGSFFVNLDSEKAFDYSRAVIGLRLVLLGMIKKICGANVLKQYADAVFGNVYAYRGPVLIVAIILYTYEIYLDFSGYTDMARGFATMLGFDLCENFKAPYMSSSIRDFFARWHISLSQWLRDYIYIPLGGSRCSKIRKYFNLMVTFLVSGIWHGASFTFIVWGFLHGIYQVGASFISDIKSKSRKTDDNAIKGNTYMQNNLIIRALCTIFTFALVAYAWMFFRANSLSDAKYITMNMFRGDNFYGHMLQMGFLKVSDYVSVILVIGLTIAYDIYLEIFSSKSKATQKIASTTDIAERMSQLNAPTRWILYIVFGVLVVVLRSHVGAGADFIYFKF